MLLDKVLCVRNGTRFALRALPAQAVQLTADAVLQQPKQLLCVGTLPQSVLHALIELLIGAAVLLQAVAHRS